MFLYFQKVNMGYLKLGSFSTIVQLEKTTSYEYQNMHYFLIFREKGKRGNQVERENIRKLNHKVQLLALAIEWIIIPCLVHLTYKCKQIFII